MSGRLGLTTPWARRYFPADERAAVESLVPDGHTLTIGARSSPTVWTLVLSRDPTPEERAAMKGPTEIHRRRVYGRDVLPAACRQALLMWRGERVA
jgi:hypothetical protein